MPGDGLRACVQAFGAEFHAQLGDAFDGSRRRGPWVAVRASGSWLYCVQSSLPVSGQEPVQLARRDIVPLAGLCHAQLLGYDFHDDHAVLRHGSDCDI